MQAAEAGSLLGGGGIVHGHSAAVFPAAAVAAPLLLDIAQQGHPAARDTALWLVDEALSSCSHAEYTRVTTPYGTAVPICCAIAHHLRARTALLAGARSFEVRCHGTPEGAAPVLPEARDLA
ncbi:hypothetical protein ACWCXB_35395 [Streptomyces sp. NPDC001514]